MDGVAEAVRRGGEEEEEGKRREAKGRRSFKVRLCYGWDNGSHGKRAWWW